MPPTDIRIEAARPTHSLATHRPIRLPVATEQPLVPPLNFALVVPGIYRSGHPNSRNHAFLLKLGIRTVIYMNEDDPQPEHVRFVKDNAIGFHHFRTKANKEPYTEINPQDIVSILKVATDTRHYPVLIHCNKGKKRVGCLVGCLRKLQGWSLAAIFDEYQRFSGSKLGIADQQFIELFDERITVDHDNRPPWLG